MGAGRRSKWEHLKNEIIQHCKEGKIPTQLFPMYPDIPRSTIHDWYKLSQKQDKQELHNENVKPFVLLEGGKKQDISDFALACEVFREIADNPEKHKAEIVIKAALGLIKLIKLRNEVSSDILNETPVSSLKIEREKLKDLSPEELQRMYQEIIR